MEGQDSVEKDQSNAPLLKEEAELDEFLGTE